MGVVEVPLPCCTSDYLCDATLLIVVDVRKGKIKRTIRPKRCSSIYEKEIYRFYPSASEAIVLVKSSYRGYVYPEIFWKPEDVPEYVVINAVARLLKIDTDKIRW